VREEEENKYCVGKLLLNYLTIYPFTYLLIYLLTHSLTHSMEQSPACEANRFAAKQEIPRIL
jgi:hypothetical protein